MRIAAVVVTFNRIKLLKENITSLRAQTQKLCQIIVVNNSSNDGTLEWLNSQEDITVITQTNSGGAGGFYTGLKYAHDKGFEWIWCMDDDTIPYPETLTEIVNTITHTPNISVVCSLPVHPANPERLSFKLKIFNSKSSFTFSVTELLQSYDINNHPYFIEGLKSFFLGTLINRKVIDKVGFPIRDLFIWGDELEYSLRIEKAGFIIGTAISAKIKHPPMKFQPTKRIFGVFIFNGDFNYLAYCYFRNQAYIARIHYRGYNLKFLIAHLIFYCIYYPNLKIIFFILRAYFDGITGNLTRKSKAIIIL